MEQSFATTMKDAVKLSPERCVLHMMHKHNKQMTDLRRYLTTDPTVPIPVRSLTASTAHWRRLHAAALKWSSPDSLPARALDICRATVVRVLRTPDSVFDDDRATAKRKAKAAGGRPEDYMPKRPDGWDGGLRHTHLRMLTAAVGVRQLRSLLGPTEVGRPMVHLRNVALAFNLAPEGKSVKDRLDKAAERGLLVETRAPQKRNPGIWVVRTVGDRSRGDERYFWPKDARLSEAEEAIAQAMFEGDESNWAAALILNVEHLAFHYGSLSPADWWLSLRVAADPSTPRLSDREEAQLFRVRSLADLDAQVSDEARGEFEFRSTLREEEKRQAVADMEASREATDAAWSNIRSHLRWDSLPSRSESLLDSEAVRKRIASWLGTAVDVLRRVPPDKRYRVDGVLSVLQDALPNRLPAHGERAFAYLKEGLSQ